MHNVQKLSNCINSHTISSTYLNIYSAEIINVYICRPVSKNRNSDIILVGQPATSKTLKEMEHAMK
jgi:hypothetical protein